MSLSYKYEIKRLKCENLLEKLSSVVDSHHLYSCFFFRTLELYCSQLRHFKSVFVNIFLINMNYEQSSVCDKKLAHLVKIYRRYSGFLSAKLFSAYL
jgi:hypothetical protein